MKKSILLFALAVAAALLLAGCGQSQTGAQTPVDSTSVSSSIEDTEDASQSSPQFPENLPDASAQPSEADQSTEETDSSGASSHGQEQAGDTSGAGDTGSGDVSTTPPASEPPAADPPAAEPPVSSTEPEQTPPAVSEPETEPEPAETTTSDTTLSGTDLTLRFGGGESFTIHMYDNPTANKIAEYVGTAAWQLPIYHFDDYDGWESFQYYDIPSRYDIPDGSQSVTSEKAGAVYYSHPNRIILFYQDANISTEYTPVGYIDFSQALVDAVENNPEVQGWGNKLVFIQP